MAKSNSQMSQHKRLAMGEKVGFKSGGSVMGAGSALPKTSNLLKSGKPTSPLTDAKRANGVPGFCKGGKMK